MYEGVKFMSDALELGDEYNQMDALIRGTFKIETDNLSLFDFGCMFSKCLFYLEKVNK